MTDLDPFRGAIAQVTFSQKREGEKSETRFTIDTEDIIAIAAGIVALLFAIAIIAGLVPLNAATVGIVTCSGAGTVIAEIVKARRKKKTKSIKPPEPADDELVV